MTEAEVQVTEVSIRQVRMRLGLSQESICTLTGISRQALSHWENGKYAQEMRVVAFVRKLQEIATERGVLQDNEVVVGPQVRVHGG